MILLISGLISDYIKDGEGCRSEEHVYCRQPTGFVDTSRPEHVCYLDKSLYGLKQAPRAWFQRFAVYVRSIGFVSSRADNSLFVLRRSNDTCYLLLYVDDIVLTASSPAFLEHVTQQLHAEFAMKDMGALHYFLGMQVTRSAHGFFLSQQRYATELLDRAGMLQCKPASTPVDTHGKLSSADGAPLEDPSAYRSMVGALQYLTMTRPDLAYPVQQACLQMHAPRDVHLAMVKRILRYVRGTTQLGLQLRASASTELIAYSDADWAGCLDTRRLRRLSHLLDWADLRLLRLLRRLSHPYRGHGIRRPHIRIP